MLHLAVREGLAELTLYLITLGVDVNAKNDCGRPALAQAAIRGLHTVVTSLLEARADATVPDDSGRTAFFYALRHNDDELASDLFSASSLLAETFTAGKLSPLVGVCRMKGLPMTVAALLEAGAEDSPGPENVS